MTLNKLMVEIEKKAKQQRVRRDLDEFYGFSKKEEK